jgi:hypothetical protein
VIGLGVKDCDRLLAIPITPDPQSVFIEPPTPIAIAKFFWIIILKRFLIHRADPFAKS